MPEKDDVRFSDEELTQLKQQFTAHKAQFEERWTQLAAMVAENTRLTNGLAVDIKRVATSTEGVVRLYTDVQAAARVGLGLQKLIVFLAKWGIIGTALAKFATYVLAKFGP